MLINYYVSVKEAHTWPGLAIEMSFDEWVEEAISASSQLNSKEEGMLFNMCSWIDDFESPVWMPGAIRRCKANVAETYALLIDVDGSMTLEETIQMWSPYEFFAYSTFGNSERKEKFRLVAPLAKPLSGHEFNERHASMCAAFNVDKASFTPSQCFYLPSYSSENKHLAWTFHNKVEERYDAFVLEPKFISENICEPPVAGSIDPRASAIYNTLITGSGLRHADALSVAVLCKSLGLGLSDFQYVISRVSAPDSSLRTGNMSLLWKDAYATHLRKQTIIETLKKLHCDLWRFRT